MQKKMNAFELYKKLLLEDLYKYKGQILFSLAGVTVKINTTDTVGIILQAWLKQYMINNNIYFSEPVNTQEFPDFFLDDVEPNKNMLEIKSFNYNASPAFDIANFESYCESVKEKPYILDADYLVFGYCMNSIGDITIEKLWLNKIWEMTGDSKIYPLKTQVKRGMIYNIRPISNFKIGTTGPFKSKDDFLKAIYETLVKYKGQSFANDWKAILEINYNNYYKTTLSF